MKRKTNLFYTSGYDSKFLTFSNYTESMTGNFLSTNTKLFPSRFIALKIEGLNDDNKQAIIKFLSIYYESKLAACRDELEKNNILPEDTMLPLNYLLEALYCISEISDDSITLTNGMTINSTIEEENNNQDNNQGGNQGGINDGAEHGSGTHNESNDGDISDDVSQNDDQTDTHDEADPENTSQNTGSTNIIIDSTNYTDQTTSPYDDIISEQDPEDEDPYDVSEEIDNDIPELELLIPNFENDSIIQLKYISDITEQNYNGTFTDTICIVDLDDYHYPVIEKISSNIFSDTTADDMVLSVDTPKYNDSEQNCVYGWENGIIDLYKGYSTIFDGGNIEKGQYRITSYIKKLNIEGNDNKADSIEFNCIIPLFDLVNTDTTTSFTTIKETTEINLLFDNNDKDENSIYKLYNLNVPLGMWIYTNGEDNLIKLYRDKETGFSQSWSLTISTQFKPFPYSKSMPNEIYTNSETAAYMTFAQVLANQNKMIEKFEHISYQFLYFDKKIADLESKINNVGTLYNIDRLHKEFIDLTNDINYSNEQFKQEVLSYINNLRWKVTQ